jgi:hypothetical protein
LGFSLDKGVTNGVLGGEFIVVDGKVDNKIAIFLMLIEPVARDLNTVGDTILNDGVVVGLLSTIMHEGEQFSVLVGAKEDLLLFENALDFFLISLCDRRKVVGDETIGEDS